jgi:tRNA nucleotidyltransferase (CCA-adding enzyme)
LNQPIKDIDIATSALPEQVMSLFPRTAPTGLQHGTVTVIMDHHTFEVTTFRRESQYEQFRRPKEVEYITSLEEDLRRRDFTMNAMAMDREGRLIDPFGGRKDLAAGLLRCVGTAEERFGEDALRMMRCIRFAAAYGLTIEGATWQALLKQAPLMRHIAMERVHSELEKMVDGPNPGRAIKLWTESGLWRYLKNPVNLKFDAVNISDVEASFQRIHTLPALHQKWALLFFLLRADSQAAKAAMQALVFSKKTMEGVTAILQFHEYLSDESVSQHAEMRWKLGAVRFGKPVLLDWLAFSHAVPPGDSLPYREYTCRGNRWLEEIPLDHLSELAVSGADLVSGLQRPAGPWVGETLRMLYEKVALGELANEKDILLQAAVEKT